MIELMNAHHARPRGVKARSAVLAVLALIFVAFLAVRAGQPSRMPPTVAEYQAARAALGQMRVIEVGEYLETSLDSPASWILGPGFLHPEEDGVWMAQLEASVRFSAPEGITPVSLELVFEPLVAASSRTRRVTVESSIDRVDARLTGGKASLLVALDGESSQEVRISCDAVDSPIGLQLGPDRRAFCAKVFGVRVRGDGP